MLRGEPVTRRCVPFNHGAFRTSSQGCILVSLLLLLTFILPSSLCLPYILLQIALAALLLLSTHFRPLFFSVSLVVLFSISLLLLLFFLDLNLGNFPLGLGDIMKHKE